MIKSNRYKRGFKFLLIILIVIPLATSAQNGIGYQTISSPWVHMTLSAKNPVLNLTYTTLTNLNPKPITSNSMIAGDHVIVKAEWTATDVNRSRLQIAAPAIPSTLVEEQNSPEVEIDTRYLGNNATCTITATAYMINGSIITQTFVNVYIGNFFVPKVRVLTPNGGDEWSGAHNITWTASDVNIADTLRFEVSLSSNSGASFVVLTSSITLKWFEWNCTGLEKLDTYVVKVRVTDGIYFSSDQSDGTFTAGDIIHSTTTTSTTTTNTTTNTLEPRVLAFIVILLISSGVMALVVYYASRKWF